MSTQTEFDPLKFKTTTRAQWDNAAEAWNRWGPFLGEWLGPATERMLDLAGGRPAAVYWTWRPALAMLST